jgi:hypothetical protein
MKGNCNARAGARIGSLLSHLKKVKEMCGHLGKDEDNDCVDSPWMGEAWIDAAELEPVRIDTHLAFKVPWAVRLFLGTNLKQTGFAILTST